MQSTRRQSDRPGRSDGSTGTWSPASSARRSSRSPVGSIRTSTVSQRHRGSPAQTFSREHRPPARGSRSRSPPDNLYTSTKSLYGLFPAKRTTPSPIFVYGAPLPPGAKASEVDPDRFLRRHGRHLEVGSDLPRRGSTPTWDPPMSTPRRARSVATANIVVEVAHITGRRYPTSNRQADLETSKSQLVGTGSGYVLRQGTVVPVTGHRPPKASAHDLHQAHRARPSILSGEDWVELVPDFQAWDHRHAGYRATADRVAVVRPDRGERAAPVSWSQPVHLRNGAYFGELSGLRTVCTCHEVVRPVHL